MSSPVPQVRSRMPRVAEAAVQRARLTVVPRRARAAARVPFVALVSLVLLGGVVGLLLFNTSMQQASFAATALESQAHTLSARQQSLQMDLDRLRDPQRIATAAQKLGMVQACSPAFLELGSAQIVGQPCVADGATPFRITPPAPVRPPALDPAPHVVHVTAPPAPAGNATGSGDTDAGATGPDRGEGRKNHRHQQSPTARR